MNNLKWDENRYIRREDPAYWQKPGMIEKYPTGPRGIIIGIVLSILLCCAVSLIGWVFFKVTGAI